MGLGTRDRKSEHPVGIVLRPRPDGVSQGPARRYRIGPIDLLDETIHYRTPCTRTSEINVSCIMQQHWPWRLTIPPWRRRQDTGHQRRQCRADTSGMQIDTDGSVLTCDRHKMACLITREITVGLKTRRNGMSRGNLEPRSRVKTKILIDTSGFMSCWLADIAVERQQRRLWRNCRRAGESR